MKTRFKRHFATTILTTVLMAFAFSAGTVTGYIARPALAAEEPAEFSIFWEAWDLVLEYFVDQDNIDFKLMTYGAIQGMLDTLGDENHTAFLPPQAAEQANSSMDGSFEGIGAYVGTENGYFTIVAPILGSPAEEAGILAGDVVFMVDGEEITGQPQWEVIQKIRGPAGSTVVLNVLHPEAEDPVDVSITRGRIDIESVLWAPIPDTNLAYVQITQFAGDTSRELRIALDEINEQPEQVEGILLDLRNNPGGLLNQALLIGSQFIEEGEVILHERDAQGNMNSYEARGGGEAREIPMVVMVNEGSASAAEILAGALRDNGRTKIVGETTLGTGTVLRPYTLSDGSVLRLGVTNWLTPNQKLIKGQGIKPDVTISQDAAVEMMSSFGLQDADANTLKESEDRQFRIGLILLKARAAK